MDSLFKELVIFGLLKKSEAVALKDYVGETLLNLWSPAMAFPRPLPPQQ